MLMIVRSSVIRYKNASNYHSAEVPVTYRIFVALVKFPFNFTGILIYYYVGRMYEIMPHRVPKVKYVGKN